MKKNAFAAVMAMLLLVVLTLGAMSAAVTGPAELWYNDIKITLDGEEIVPKDAAGNIVSPFIIDGTTYLPVRAVAQAVDLDVEWDEISNTVKLSGTPTQDEVPVYSRDNPAPLGVSQTVIYNGTVSQAKVTEIIRGDEAFDLIIKDSVENEKLTTDMEYLVAYVSISMLLQNNTKTQNKNYYGLTITGLNTCYFEACSADGNMYDRYNSSFQNAERLSLFRLEEGTVTEGCVAFFVRKDDPAPMAVYGQDIDGTGSAWFSLTKN
jgi:hypothetical protein